MALISLREISLSFGGLPIFDCLNLQIESGERIALLGRNGAGKTTLMKVINAQQKIDKGNVVVQKSVQSAHLPQDVPVNITGSVFDVVLSGLGERYELINQHHNIIHRLQIEETPELLEKLNILQEKLNHTDSWDLSNQVDEVISKMKLDKDSDFAMLSGGQKRRVLLARALVKKPDVLLLDEPTNHLDIDSMLWLEGFLLNYPGTVFFVTHDRMFMTRLATRILELDRGKIFSWACDYKTFLDRKQAALDAKQSETDNFDKKLAKEEVWIRQGIKARRCRNEGRVKALERLREEKKRQRREIGQVSMQSQKVDPSGHRVVKISQLDFWYGEKCIVKDFSTQIMRGDKIGVIGSNGSGKTTLLRLLLGELTPQRGKVSLGTNLQIAYYDQLREQLEEEKTVAENVSEGSENVIINGKPRHIIGYLQDFLFTPDRARTPVKILSGGERNRLFLARLFSKPSNVLVMDEPTNDLDIETLTLLEELLLDYSGTLILVSHDRAFLNNVVTSTMVLEGDGSINEYAGGYDDWLSQKKSITVASIKSKPIKIKEIRLPKKTKIIQKITPTQQCELDNLSSEIEKMEAQQKEMYVLLADPNFYKQSPDQIVKTNTRLAVLSSELEKAYQRWEYLEKLSNMS